MVIIRLDAARGNGGRFRGMKDEWVYAIIQIMVVVPRFTHHRHTGRLRPHHETSYALLCFILLLVGGVLATVSLTASAALEGGGTYKVEGVVMGARPDRPAVITSPTTGQAFQTNPITVAGTCPDRMLVKIFKNGVLAGGTICGQGGRFSLQLDLLIGRNDLTALAYNANDLAGPDSPTVSVTLNVPSGGLGFSSELVIQSVNFYRGTHVGEEVVWPVELVGGQPPYSVNFDWGDGKSDLVTRVAPGAFDLRHIYTKPGGYLGAFPLIIRASDAAGHTAYLQLTTIVNDPKSVPVGSAKPTASTPLYLAWPLWVALLLMVVSFWLGERWQKHVLLRRLAEVA